MTPEQRAALAAVRFDWAQQHDDVWQPHNDFHVPGLHQQVFDDVLAAFDDAQRSLTASPIGVVVQGRRGTGKTHLLGQIRAEVQRRRGYFFLIRLLDSQTFWRTTLFGMLTDLDRPTAGHPTQLVAALSRLAEQAGVSDAVRAAVTGETDIDPDTLDEFVNAVYRVDRTNRRATQHILRALVLSAASDGTLFDLGDAYLRAVEVDPEDYRPWKIQRVDLGYEDIANRISQLLARTGPAVLAVDQIDTLLAQSHRSGDVTVDPTDAPESVALEHIAHGLMSLREGLHRTATVVSCMPAAWIAIEDKATSSVADRFRTPELLKRIPSAEFGRKVLERRLSAHYASAGFQPPHPAWPIAPTAFESAPNYTPRQLLISVDAHIRTCLESGEVSELTSFGSADDPSPATVRADRVDAALDSLDAQFAHLRSAAKVSELVAHEAEDTHLPNLLGAGLSAWIVEHGAQHEWNLDQVPTRKPPVHARLRRVLDATAEDEQHWAFRAIGHPHPRAAVTRLQNACTATGLDGNIADRKLIVLRNQPWSGGPKTRDTVAEFERAGGRTVRLDDDDVRTLFALQAMSAAAPPGYESWLQTRKPAQTTMLFRTALAGAVPSEAGRHRRHDADTAAADPSPTTGDVATTDTPGTETSETARTDASVATPAGASSTAESRAARLADTATITIGTAHERPIDIDLQALRKHTAIFAGSGSGKTVLIRRLIEECALQGVSSIVLDPNNDLSRLGVPWPDGHAWADGDAERAARYLRDTDVVVWTPRKQSGRPLTFQPLPDFSGVADDPDEFGQAVDAAVAALVPQTIAAGSTAKADQAKAVLRAAVGRIGRRSENNGLRGLVALLEELPDGVSDLKKAEKLAAELAENIKARMQNDPLFGGAGTPVDIGELLTPASGYRARVSVINLAGLPADEQRHNFVNQLQMALFAWIKKNPAGDRPLGGVFVMDEAQTFAPSDKATACTQSTLALTSQARKYGLGLVFATQAPKGLHNRIPGNASTQFFGKLSAPSHITAAREMARARGGDIVDIGHLHAGQFYVVADGIPLVQAQTPMCLSHHPASAPTEEEVLALARRAH